MTTTQTGRNEKGTCLSCGGPAPDSVICDSCFAHRFFHSDMPKAGCLMCQVKP